MASTIAALERKVADLERRLNALARVGRVSASKAAGATARVTFDDDDDGQGTPPVSHDLSVLQPRTKGAQDYSVLAADEQVLCLFLPAAEGGEVGFVLGCHYSDEDAPPADDPNLRVLAGGEVRVGSVDASQVFVFGVPLKTYLDSHTHPTPAGPSGPPSLAFNVTGTPGYPHLSEKVKGE